MHTVLLGRRAFGSAIVALALLAGGCAVRTFPAPSTPRVIRPGDRGLGTLHFRDTVQHLRLELLAAGADSALSTVAFTRTERLIDLDGERGLLLSFAYGPPLNTADTLAVRRRDLMPRWEVLHVRGSRLRFQYRDTGVQAETTTSDSAPRRQTHTFDRAPFAFNELEAVIRSLPLRAGYEALLPLYSEIDGRVEMDTVSVVPSGESEGSGEPRAVWRVRFADPAIVQTYEIDQRTRQVRSRQVVQRRGGRRMRYVQVPEGPASGS
jgi:hypothetical protein